MDLGGGVVIGQTLGHYRIVREIGAAGMGVRGGALVTVVGVGYFAFRHSVRGQAPNGFELHPIIAVIPGS